MYTVQSGSGLRCLAWCLPLQIVNGAIPWSVSRARLYPSMKYKWDFVALSEQDLTFCVRANDQNVLAS